MSNAPGWLWFGIALLILLAIQWFVGIRVDVG